MRTSRQTIENFEGVALNVHKARLKPSVFQVDENGDRSNQGSWQVRRGLAHGNVAQEGAAISSIHGLVVQDGRYFLVHANDTEINGSSDPTVGVLDA